MQENHPEHLNTPRLITNDQGQTVWRWDQQEPFGVNVPDENPSGLGTFDLPLRLPGQYFDAETGLHYNYYRDYDPSIGRYGQSDPAGLKGGLNSYRYVGADPIRFIDRFGLQAQSASCCPDLSDSQCCQTGLARGDFNSISGIGIDEGGVLCCNGRKVACAFTQGKSMAAGIVRRCVIEHERKHFDDVDCGPGCGIDRPPHR